MHLDQQTESFLAAGKDSPPLYQMSVADARLALSEMSRMAGGAPVAVGAYQARMVVSPAGPIPVRIYWPEQGADATPRPLLLFFHGGGFALGDASTHDAICRSLCTNGGVIVINVDYRRSPEHKFPAAPEDCYAVLRWAAAKADSLSARADRIAVAGDSAGGNLAAVVTQMARDRDGPAIAYQVLIYPVVDMDLLLDTRSRRTFGESGYVLTRKDMAWLTDMYVTSSEDLKNPYVSPLHAASFAGLPPALIITAGCDPLCDEGKMYADRLAAAGVATEYICYENTVHGFVSFSGVVDLGKQALALIGQRLAKIFGALP
jgi:acetyl esterase